MLIAVTYIYNVRWKHDDGHYRSKVLVPHKWSAMYMCVQSVPGETENKDQRIYIKTAQRDAAIQNCGCLPLDFIKFPAALFASLL
jgi:hypothetical protein